MMLGPTVALSAMFLLTLTLWPPAMTVCACTGASRTITSTSFVASMTVGVPLLVHGRYTEIKPHTSLLSYLVAITLAHLLVVAPRALANVARRRAIAGGLHVEVLASCMKCQSPTLMSARPRGTPGSCSSTTSTPALTPRSTCSGRARPMFQQQISFISADASGSAAGSLLPRRRRHPCTCPWWPRCPISAPGHKAGGSKPMF